MLADVIQDIGNHRPAFRFTPAGADLNILGNAIKFAVQAREGAQLDLLQQDRLERGLVVAVKHGGIRPGLPPVEGYIETAKRLLGIWER